MRSAGEYLPRSKIFLSKITSRMTKSNESASVDSIRRVFARSGITEASLGATIARPVCRLTHEHSKQIIFSKSAKADEKSAIASDKRWTLGEAET